MIAGRSDLPLSREPSVRLVPWIIALMTFLACMMLAGALLLSDLLGQWTRDLSGTATVQVMPRDGETAEALQERVAKLVRLLERRDEVASARDIPLDEIAELLAPWLGTDAPLDGLPLPRLIDIRLADGQTPASLDSLRTMLDNADPDAELDDHGTWRQEIAGLVRALEYLAALGIGLVALATVGIVIFVTRSGMAAHQDVIEVLHHIGAEDSYIARQFQRHALAQGLRGGLIGLVLAAGSLWALDRASSGLDTALLPPFGLDAREWAILAAIPLATALIANWTARRTVMRSLGRMV